MNSTPKILSLSTKIAFVSTMLLFQMLDEISQYSDVHKQQYQDYGSVQRLMHSYFQAMSGESGSAPFVSFLADL